MAEIPTNQQLRQSTEGHLYQCYGLRIRADRALPELLGSGNAEHPCDIQVVEGEIDLAMPTADQIAYRPVSSGNIVVQWPAVGALRVENGCAITYQMTPGADPLVFRMFLYCQGLGVLLQQRHLLVLHASCVLLGEHAVAFAGVSGEGKSTLAAMCCERGGRILADDVLAISFEPAPEPMAWPGFGRLKLRPEISRRLTFPADEGRPIGEYGKFLHSAGTLAFDAPARLDRIYLLGRGAAVEIQRLGLREAFPQLVHHSYGRALIPYLQLEALHFWQCSTLIGAGIVRRLSRPRDLDFLSATLDAVCADLADSD